MENLIKEVIFYSVLNSFVVFGLSSTILRVANKDSMSRFINLSITYALGITMGFMLKDNFPIWQKLVYGLSIGAISIALYKSAIQALLNLIPTLVERLVGVKSTIITSNSGTNDGDSQV